jgi:hypothetical protein
VGAFWIEVGRFIDVSRSDNDEEGEGTPLGFPVAATSEELNDEAGPKKELVDGAAATLETGEDGSSSGGEDRNRKGDVVARDNRLVAKVASVMGAGLVAAAMDSILVGEKGGNAW